MSAEQLAIVFEPFVQFDSKLSRENAGTGLGMPISRELARGMGGDLVATSEQGAGTTFTLSLPLAS
jgi:signal transduction histidine kinase